MGFACALPILHFLRDFSIASIIGFHLVPEKLQGYDHNTVRLMEFCKLLLRRQGARLQHCGRVVWSCTGQLGGVMAGIGRVATFHHARVEPSPAV